MATKEMIVLVTLLLVISACSNIGKKGTETTNTSQNNAGTNINSTDTANTQAVTQSDLDYCKMVVRAAQLKADAAQRQEEVTNANIADLKAKIDDLKTKKGDPQLIAAKEKDLTTLNDKLSNVQKSIPDAKAAVDNIAAKCNKIAKKADKTICKEFKDDMDKQITDAKGALAKLQSDLDSLNNQLDAAKTTGKAPAIIRSIQDKREKENLEILKANNTIDKLNQMSQQLTKHCG